MMTMRVDKCWDLLWFATLLLWPVGIQHSLKHLAIFLKKLRLKIPFFFSYFSFNYYKRKNDNLEGIKLGDSWCSDLPLVRSLLCELFLTFAIIFFHFLFSFEFPSYPSWVLLYWFQNNSIVSTVNRQSH